MQASAAAGAAGIAATGGRAPEPGSARAPAPGSDADADAAGPAIAPPADDFARDRLIGSVRSRARQSIFSLVQVVLLTCLFLWSTPRDIEPLPIGLWFSGVLGMLVVRYLCARRATAALDATGYPAAVRFDRYFRAISAVSQIVTGAGVWLAYGHPNGDAGYLMTLLVMFYGVGTMVGLAHDARSFNLTLPLLLGQPMLFWMLQGVPGMAMAAGTLGMLFMMRASVRSSQEQFDQGIRIRHEKNALLYALDRKNTELDAANNELQRALEETERANRAKSYFLATASHDVRQPIIAATLIGDYLQQLPLEEHVQQRLAEQRTTLREVQSMLDNVLDLARFEEGRLNANLRALPLAPLFEYLRATYTPMCERKALRLFAPDTELWVVGDQTMLQRLLGNLLANAANYTERGNVALRAERRGDQVRISVIDTGRGISEDDRARIFEPFVRIEDSEKRKTSGVGLGLAIVRALAGAMGVMPTVDSIVGAGTRISIDLPHAEPDTEAPAQTCAERIGAAGRLDGRTLWTLTNDDALSRQLDPELYHLGCIWSTPGDLETCRDLVADGEAPDWLIVDAASIRAEFVDALLAWSREALPETHVLVLTPDMPARPRGATGATGAIGAKPLADAEGCADATPLAADTRVATLPSPADNAAVVQWLVQAAA